MIAKSPRLSRIGVRNHRTGSAAVEFCVCLPFITTLLLGLWEMGRMVEVQQVVYNSAREAARDASMGQSNLQAVASNLLLYLQNGEPTAFGQGHSTSVISPVIALPANTYGYTVWDNTANQELFTFTFSDTTNTTVTDPTGMAQLDVYVITVSYPASSVSWVPIAWITGMGRFSASTTWACMVDSPFILVSNLQAQ